MQKFFENCMNSDHLNHKDYNLVVLDEEDPTGLFGVASEMAKEEIFLDLKREYGDQGAIMVYNLHSSLGKFLRREVDLQCLTDSVSNLVNIM